MWVSVCVLVCACVCMCVCVCVCVNELSLDTLGNPCEKLSSDSGSGRISRIALGLG